MSADVPIASPPLECTERRHGPSRPDESGARAASGPRRRSERPGTPLERLGDLAARVSRLLRSLRRSRTYPLAGLVLAPAAPAGLLLARGLEAGRLPTLAWALEDAWRWPVTYLYLMGATAAVLALLGHVLGRSYDRARVLAITDPLTGLFNRRHFEERLAEELRQGSRRGRPTSVLCVDLDHLKAINDGSGHLAGDHALLAVSTSLAKYVRSTDVVARLGGDEFALLLPGTSVSDASALARRIQADVGRHCETLREGSLTASIGIAQIEPRAEIEARDLLAAADAALYRAKAAGGGRISSAIRVRSAAGPAWLEARLGCHGSRG